MSFWEFVGTVIIVSTVGEVIVKVIEATKK